MTKIFPTIQDVCKRQNILSPQNVVSPYYHYTRSIIEGVEKIRLRIETGVFAKNGRARLANNIICNL